jgi:hypothetical protein
MNTYLMERRWISAKILTIFFSYPFQLGTFSKLIVPIRYLLSTIISL